MKTRKTCLVIGDPVEHSLSPAMHSAGYNALGIADEFTFRAERVTASDLPAALACFQKEGITGISCTMPHKEALVPLLTDIEAEARHIGAVNTLLNRSGSFVGINTDWLGIVRPLEAQRPLRSAAVAVIGAGGAARAAVFGLVRNGAKVTVLNRSLERAAHLAQAFGAQARALYSIETLASFQIIINASPVGMGALSDESPIPLELICKDQLVFDTVYHPKETKLLRGAAERGAKTISGTEMLLHQGAVQFALYTGREAPIAAMRAALETSLSQRAAKV